MLSLENNLQQVQTGKATQPGHVGNSSTVPSGKEGQSQVAAPILILIIIEPNYEE